MTATARTHTSAALGRLLVRPPRGLDPDLARLIDALAREAARRDHAAENSRSGLVADKATGEADAT